MAYRRKSYTYWDGDAIFPIPFEYLEQDDILVFINDEPTTDFVIENTQVKLNNVPAEVPAIIKIVSATDIDKAIVDWENVSSLDEDNLILSDNQIRYAVQELYDNTEQFKVDTNQSFEDYKQETNQNIDNFREEIHTLLDDVSEAAELISSTIEAVDTAVLTTQEQALLATEQKELATEQANIAIENTQLVASTANKALEDIATLTTNSTQALESLTEASTEEINTLGNTIKSDATDWIDVINAIGKSYNMVTHRQITNCITEIPQDIKLELNDGVLTLKAGSKVYVPNGFEADGTTPKFDEVVVPNDMANTNFWGDVRFVVYEPSGRLIPMPVSDSFSGATQPSTAQYALWYDTANNLVKSTSDNGVTWLTGHSLPICTAYGTNGTTVTRIDQTFNGFGYIGSTVYVTKGVKGLIPNGRNEDGTLNNIEVVTDKVGINNIAAGDKTISVIIYNNGAVNNGHSLINSDTPPSQTYKLYYKEEENEIWNTNNNAPKRIYAVVCATATMTYNNGITSFTPKLPFRAVDYSEFKSDLTSIVPTGTVISFAANSNPNGYILCNGSAVSRTTYASLFSVIGTTYGSGDGSTTFNLPNLTDKFIQGSGTAGTAKEAGLPNITGTFTTSDSGTYTGAFYVNGTASSKSANNGTADDNVHFNASRSSAIYGKSSTVQPPALTMRYYIKY